MIRRHLVLAFALAIGLAACQKGGVRPISADEMTMGDPHAKVTVIEYASVACPICAAFGTQVFPEFKQKYIDTGKVRFVFREALTGNPALAASGFLLARCAGKDKYFKVVEAVFRAQDEIYEPGTETIQPAVAHDVLSKIAQQAGLSEQQMNSCITDDKGLEALNARVEKSSRKDNIEATPTFIINGKKYEGFQSLSQMDSEIQPLLK